MSELKRAPINPDAQMRQELHARLKTSFNEAQSWWIKNRRPRHFGDGFAPLSPEELYRLGGTILKASSVWEAYEHLAETGSGGRTYYDAIVGAQHENSYTALDYGLRNLESATVERGLDIATGTGSVAAALSSCCRQVIATDIMPPLLAHAQRKLHTSGVKESLVLAMDALDLGFAPDSFDIVTCNGIGAFITQDEYVRLLQQIHRTLKPGGRFYEIRIVDPHPPVYEKSPRARLAGEVSRCVNLFSNAGAHMREGGLKAINMEDFGFQGGHYDIRGFHTKMQLVRAVKSS